MARTCGKASTYNNGKCRCPACRAAIADYRAGRREQGLDKTPSKKAPEVPVAPAMKESA